MEASPPEQIEPGRLGRLVGRAVYRRVSAVAATMEVVGAGTARQRLAPWLGTGGSGPIFLYYWIEDALPLMVYACHADTGVDGSLRFVCDDTLAGRITAEIIRCLGRRHVPLRLGSDASRVRDVQRLIVERGPLGIAVDGRGPYGRVGREFARLARRRGAMAIPVAVRVDRAWRLRSPAPLTVARRGGRISVEVGPPVAPDGGPADLLQHLQEALDVAGDRAQRGLTGTRSRSGVSAPEG